MIAINSKITITSELLNKIRLIDLKYNLGYENKLKKDLKQCFSNLSEIYFGVFLDEIAYSIKRGKTEEGKTPDFECIVDNQRVIFEVFRLEDTDNHNYLQDLRIKFKSINIHCVLILKYYDTKSVGRINENELINIIKSWLNTPKQKGDKMSIHKDFDFEFLKYNVSGNVDILLNRWLKFNPHRLKSKIFEKAEKYKNFIVSNKLPFVICIDVTNGSNFDLDDVKVILYGKSVEDRRYNEYTSYYTKLDDSLFSIENLKLKHVSGVLIYYDSEYCYYENFYADYKISNVNLKKIQYKDRSIYT